MRLTVCTIALLTAMTLTLSTPTPAVASASAANQVAGAKRTHLFTSRPTVHPKATVVRDRVQLVLVVRGWNPYDEEFGGTWQARTTLRIVDSRNRVVALRRVRDTYTPAFTWDGRHQDGRALPKGSYVARVRSVDNHGHRVTRSARLRVSHRKLEERVWTASFPATEARTYEPYFGGCNGCSEYCAPVASARFPGGLSFRPCDDGVSWGCHAAYGLDVPFDEAPEDRYRVSVTGGPTSAGVPANADLTVGEIKAADVPPVDDTTVSAWVKVRLARQPFQPSERLPVVWGFTTTGNNSYDVASFTVEYRHYVPAT